MSLCKEARPSGKVLKSFLSVNSQSFSASFGENYQKRNLRVQSSLGGRMAEKRVKKGGGGTVCVEKDPSAIDEVS